MNHIITPDGQFASLLPAIEALVTKRGGTLSDRYELEDTVLRAGGYAWDIGEEAAPLHAQIAELTAAKEAADAAEAARIAALPAAPWRVSKDTLIGRIVATGKLDSVMAIYAAQSAADKFVFDQSAWFSSDNVRMRSMCQFAGLDADMMFARDETI